MADPADIPDELLAEIRRAAFELRQEQPQEAMRVLRRVAAAGGAAEGLARGALGELYFDEFGDLDGAAHEDRLRWAAEERLCDALADEDPEAARDDWARFHSLWTRLRALQGRAAEAAQALLDAERAGQLGAAQCARLRSEALEDAGDLRAA